MARRKAPHIADELLDHLLSGTDAATALQQGGVLDERAMPDLNSGRQKIAELQWLAAAQRVVCTTFSGFPKAGGLAFGP